MSDAIQRPAVTLESPRKHSFKHEQKAATPHQDERGRANRSNRTSLTEPQVWNAQMTPAEQVSSTKSVALCE